MEEILKIFRIIETSGKSSEILKMTIDLKKPKKNMEGFKNTKKLWKLKIHEIFKNQENFTKSLKF